jgi:hypothetical protein
MHQVAHQLNSQLQLLVQPLEMIGALQLVSSHSKPDQHQHEQ